MREAKRGRFEKRMIQIYHFEGRHRFFIGTEEIEDKRPEMSLPAYSTDIRPPLEFLAEGQVPVFNGIGWDIVPDTFWKPKWTVCSYDAGRTMDTYQPLHLSMYSKHFPLYPSIPMLCNTTLVVQAICQRVRLVHDKFTSLLVFHRRIMSESVLQTPLDSPNFEMLHSAPCDLYRYKLDCEAMIYLMRRVLDILVQLTYLLTHYEDFDKNKSIPISEIGKLLKDSPPTTDLERIILGDENEYEKDTTGFLVIINNLFNSFKHCLIHDESYPVVGATFATIVSFQAKHNRYDGHIIYHNHDATHIMMGFQDTVVRILKNQRKYQLRQNVDGDECSPL